MGKLGSFLDDFAASHSAHSAHAAHAANAAHAAHLARRVVVERLFAPVPLGWRVVAIDECGERHRFVTAIDGSVRSRLVDAGWTVTDHVAGWSARPPGPVVVTLALSGDQNETTSAAVDLSHVVGEVRRCFERSEVAIIPTDTVYGVVIPAALECGADLLARVKGRSATQPFQVLVSSLEQAADLTELRPQALRFLTEMWPGGVTAICKRRPGVAMQLGGDEDSIGIRFPADPLCDAIISRVGPLIASSANRSGEPPVENGADLAVLCSSGALPGVGLVVDAGVIARPASSVVDVRGDSLVVLREGSVAAEDLHRHWDHAGADSAELR